MTRSNPLVFTVFILAVTLHACSSPPQVGNSLTDTQAPPAAPSPSAISPSATPVQYPILEKPMDRVPIIVISAAPNDPRIPLVTKAVDNWNQQFKQIGIPFRLGAVVQTTERVPDQDLIVLGTPPAAQAPAGPPPQDLLPALNKMPGDIVIALSSASFISFTHLIGMKKLIGIQGHPGGTDSANIVENVIEHELGHAIGLGPNNDPSMLMCGRPAPCRPGADQFVSIQGFAPLTDAEKAHLLKIYPPDWQPTH